MIAAKPRARQKRCRHPRNKCVRVSYVLSGKPYHAATWCGACGALVMAYADAPRYWRRPTAAAKVAVPR